MYSDKKSDKIPLHPKVEQVVEAYITMDSLSTDPMGSYTGKTTDPDEIPIQDADDL